MTQVSPKLDPPTDWLPGGNLSSIAKEVECLVNRQLRGLQEQEKKVAELRREVCAEEANIEKMKKTISKCNRKIDVAMDKVEECATTAEDLREEIRNSIVHYCNIEYEEKRKRAAIEDLQKWHTEYQSKTDKVREAAEKHIKESPASVEIARHQEEIQQLQKEKEQRKACMDVDKSDLTALSQEVCHLQEDVAEATAHICTLEREIDQMKNSFAARLRKLKCAVMPKEKELEQMRSQLAYLTSQAVPLSPVFAPRMKALGEEWACLMGQLQNLQEEVQTSQSSFDARTANGRSFSPGHQNGVCSPME